MHSSATKPRISQPLKISYEHDARQFTLFIATRRVISNEIKVQNLLHLPKLVADRGD